MDTLGYETTMFCGSFMCFFCPGILRIQDTTKMPTELSDLRTPYHQTAPKKTYI